MEQMDLRVVEVIPMVGAAVVAAAITVAVAVQIVAVALAVAADLPLLEVLMQVLPQQEFVQGMGK